MKLTIRSDVALKLQKILTISNTNTCSLYFGRMYRSGFSSFINLWDYNCLCKGLSLKLDGIKQVSYLFENQMLCDMGPVGNYDIYLGSCTEKKSSSKVDLLTFIFELFQISLITTQSKKYQMSIYFPNYPKTLNDLFVPIKMIYSTLSSCIIPCLNPQQVIDGYNSNFDHHGDSIPWITPQKMHYLSQPKIETLQNYVVLPLYSLIKVTLYLHGTKAYLISKDTISEFLGNTNIQTINVISGFWKDSTFFAYDAIIIDGESVQNKSYIYRSEAMSNILLHFSFGTRVQYARDLYNATKEFLCDHEGVIYIPIRAHYTNNRTFIYQPVAKAGIRFEIQPQILAGFSSYLLRVGKMGEIFKGTQKFPFSASIPLTDEDRVFIGPLNKTVVEFRWENNNLVPYACAHNKSLTPLWLARKIWNYINDYVNIETLLEQLRVFKKDKANSK